EPDVVEGDAEPPLALGVFDRRVEVGGAAHVVAQERGFDLADTHRLSRPKSSRLEDRQNGPSIVLVARRREPDAIEGDAEPSLARSVLDRRVEVGGAAHVVAQESGFDLADAHRLSRPNASRQEDRQNGPSIVLVSRQSGHRGCLPVRRTYAAAVRAARRSVRWRSAWPNPNLRS